MTQPTLSQQIGQLEKELGAQLFERAGKKVYLTQAGQIFSEYARRAVREMEDAQVALAELEGLERGELRLGVVQTINTYLVPNLVARFHSAYPAVKLRIHELSASEIESGLLSGALDLGIGFLPCQSAELKVHPLFDEDLFLVVSPEHKLAGRRTVKLRDLDGENMVLLSPAFCTRRLWDEAAQRAGICPQIVIEMNSIEGILATVRASGTASVLPALALKGEHDRKNPLQAVQLQDPTPCRKVGLMHRRNAYRCAASTALFKMTSDLVSSEWANESGLP